RLDRDGFLPNFHRLRLDMRLAAGGHQHPEQHDLNDRGEPRGGSHLRDGERAARAAHGRPGAALPVFGAPLSGAAAASSVTSSSSGCTSRLSDSTPLLRAAATTVATTP